MSLGNLEVLKQNQREILLAEVVGWLHDMGKCADEQIRAQANDAAGFKHAYKKAFSGFLDSSVSLTIGSETVSLRDLIEQGTPGAAKDASRSWPWLIRALGRCHGAAHVEKEESDESGKQPQADTRPSTPFGIEDAPISGLTGQFKALPLNPLAQRNDLLPKISSAFTIALGDTRRPENEVTLWDWSSVVSALFKAVVAGAVLGQQPQPNDLRWRLLVVRADRFAFLSRAVRLADLDARQAMLDNAFEHVRVLIEETFPIGTRVYADADAQLYIVPDISNLLALKDTNGKTFQDHIADAFGAGRVQDDPHLRISGELVPDIMLDGVTWFGQSYNWNRYKPYTPPDEIPPIARVLSVPVHTMPNPAEVQSWWTGSLQAGELCPVCRLRPMREKAEACEHCLKQRGSRIEWWHEHPQQTIWMDEIADHHDRVALLVGKFGLDDWLSGDLVQTMLVRCDPNNSDPTKRFVSKNPSPARLRRVWETCQRFWTETVGGILEHYGFGGSDALRCTRVAVVPDSPTRWQENVPYDGTINGKAVSLLWQQNEGRFITIGNLQLGVAQARDEIGLVGEWHGCECTVTLPNRPGRTRTFTVKCVELLNGKEMRTYAPYLTLPQSPDLCLTLVPAAEVLDIAGQIKDEYEKQMGKVQNRLPLFLGVVFFQRKTPLMAVMDAGRRMANVEWRVRNEEWQVECNCTSADGTEQHLRLSHDNQRLSLEVPVKMGDGTTDDVWYPYFELVGTPAAHHTHYFKRDGQSWVHVKNLQCGETVCVTPSRFACLFLESTAERFRFDPATDVMLLGELTDLRKMWEQICQSPDMSDTRLQAIHALFEGKRQEWKLGEPTPERPITDETFRHLVETTLKRDKVQGVTAQDVLNGCFRRCLDLHWHILKRRVSDERKK